MLQVTLFLTALAGSPLPVPAPQDPPADEFAGLWVQDLHPGDQPEQRYFLMGREGAEAPKAGFKLLVVLPGGSGSADFQPFVKRIALNALGPDYLVAQLVAPVWSPEQAKQLVWPLEKNPWHGMEFSTEEFLDAVLDHVGARHAIDPGHVFTLAWSSGGPAAYAYSVRPRTRVTGTFVAMSVFKPGQMESLRNARGHAYFLLHSPEDFIPIAMAEDARDKLGKKQAEVKLVTYAGGHGWHGDVYGHLRQGFAFLEKEHAKPRRR